MKRTTLILALLSTFNVWSSAKPSIATPASPDSGNDVILHLDGIGKDGVKRWYRVKKERLSRLPTWDGKTEPPLSISSAIKIAENYIQKAEPDSKRASLASVFMNNIYSPGQENHWFYKLIFNTGGKYMHIYVLMDGSVVEPIPFNNK